MIRTRECRHEFEQAVKSPKLQKYELLSDIYVCQHCDTYIVVETERNTRRAV